MERKKLLTETDKREKNIPGNNCEPHSNS